MVISAHRPWEEPSPEPDLSDYTSNVIRLFVEGLERRQAGQVLDLGPVCNDNISFFARRVKRLYVCDMFLRLDRDRRKGLPPNRTWQHLDYPPQSFDGILLWDLADRLKDHEVRDLVKRCHTMSRPGGMVMVFVLGQKATLPVVNAFTMGDGFRLHLRPQPHLDLPTHLRQNREVLSLFAPFNPIKSFIYRNGLREFLFQCSDSQIG